MRRQFTIFLLIATLLLPAAFLAPASALAQNETLVAEIQARQQRIQNILDYFKSSEQTGKTYTPTNWDSVTMGDPVGWYYEADTFTAIGGAPVTQAEDGRPNSPSPLSYGQDGYWGCGIGDPCALLKTKGEVVSYWQSRCFSFIGLAEEFGKIADEAAAMAATPNLPEAAAAIIKKAALDAEANAIGAAMLPATRPHPCMAMYANVYRMYYESAGSGTGPGNFWICGANWIANKDRSPEGADGTCTIRNLSTWDWGKPKDCTGCPAMTIALKSSGQPPSWYGYLTHYTVKPTPTSSGTDMLLTLIKTYEEKAKAIRADLAKAGGEVASAKADAEKLGSELQARGTALSLPLPLSDITIPDLIGRILNTLLGIVGAVALLLFTWGGIRWMTAAGNQDQIGKAKSTITWAAIGLVAIFSAYAILQLVIDTFK